MTSLPDFLAQLGSWPNDYNRQIDFISRLKLLLTQANTFLVESAGEVVLLSQASEPSQVKWENAWTSQTGLSLPIPPSAQLHWWNTSLDVFGGLYGTVQGNSTVYRRDSLYPNGGTLIVAADHKTSKITASYAMGTNLADHPKVSISLPVTCHLILRFQVYVKLSAGSGQWGADFLFNGVKVGTQYMGLAVNIGIQNQEASGLISVEHVISNVPPGDYEIQAIFGVTASPVSPPTFIIGGLSGADSYGARQLVVRGVAV